MSFRLSRPRLLPFGPVHMLLALAVLLLVLFVYSGVQTATQNYRLAEQHRELGHEIVELQGQVRELEGLRDYLASDEYIEGVARSRFGLVRSGETAVIVDAPGAKEPGRAPGERWWESLFGR